MSTATEANEENTIGLKDGVEYYAIVRIVSTKDSKNVKVTVERGPSSHIEDAPDDALIEIPASWKIVERILDIMGAGSNEDEDEDTQPRLSLVTNEKPVIH